MEREIVNGRAGCIRCSNLKNVRFRHEQRTGNTLLSQRPDRRGLLCTAQTVSAAAGALFLHPQGRAGLRKIHVSQARRRRRARSRAGRRPAALRGRPRLARRGLFPGKTLRLLRWHGTAHRRPRALRCERRISGSRHVLPHGGARHGAHPRPERRLRHVPPARAAVPHGGGRARCARHAGAGLSRRPGGSAPPGKERLRAGIRRAGQGHGARPVRAAVFKCHHV